MGGEFANDICDHIIDYDVLMFMVSLGGKITSGIYLNYKHDIHPRTHNRRYHGIDMKILRFAHEQGTPWPNNELSAKEYTMENVVFMVENGCKFQLDTLLYKCIVHSNIELIEKHTTKEQIVNFHQSTPKKRWINTDLIYESLFHGSTKVIKFFQDNYGICISHNKLKKALQNTDEYPDSDDDSTAYMSYIFKDRLICALDFLNDKTNTEYCSVAAGLRDPTYLMLLHQSGFAWDITTATKAFLNTNMFFIQYVVNNGCPWDIASIFTYSHKFSKAKDHAEHIEHLKECHAGGMNFLLERATKYDVGEHDDSYEENLKEYQGDIDRELSYENC